MRLIGFHLRFYCPHKKANRSSYEEVEELDYLDYAHRDDSALIGRGRLTCYQEGTDTGDKDRDRDNQSPGRR